MWDSDRQYYIRGVLMATDDEDLKDLRESLEWRLATEPLSDSGVQLAKLRKKYPDIMYLIRRDPNLSHSERIFWIKRMPTMTPLEATVLRDMLYGVSLELRSSYPELVDLIQTIPDWPTDEKKDWLENIEPIREKDARADKYSLEWARLSNWSRRSLLGGLLNAATGSADDTEIWMSRLSEMWWLKVGEFLVSLEDMAEERLAEEAYMHERELERERARRRAREEQAKYEQKRAAIMKLFGAVMEGIFSDASEDGGRPISAPKREATGRRKNHSPGTLILDTGSWCGKGSMTAVNQKTSRKTSLECCTRGNLGQKSYYLLSGPYTMSYDIEVCGGAKYSGSGVKFSIVDGVITKMFLDVKDGTYTVE